MSEPLLGAETGRNQKEDNKQGKESVLKGKWPPARLPEAGQAKEGASIQHPQIKQASLVP